ncbi:MAG: SDR family oxidoreductase [Planctomycetes bacterium]|nr:SDR family oxidoreductase [Planctomycetota bacterium]
MRLENTVALVTGGAKRVGRAISLELARGGCDVAVHFRTSGAEAGAVAEKVRELGRRATTVSGDLSLTDEWPALIGRTVQQLGRLDILINSASEFRLDGAATVDAFRPESWDRMLRVNLTAPMALCHYARPHLAARGCGRIINLTDVSAERPWPDHLAYCCSKAGLTALTRALARALAPDVMVNAIAPGIAIFPDDYSAEQRSRLVAQVPLRRAGTPEDVARVARALLESGDYVSGEIIHVDGGRHVA